MERVSGVRPRGAARDHVTDEQIRAYLRSVQSSLQVSRTQRRRVLEEIENHIHDGSLEHMRSGATQQEAVALVIAELGPPEIVGAAFVEDVSPVSRVTGVQRWLPLVLPAVLLVLAVAGILWTITIGVREAWTFGGQLATWWYGRTAAIAALLVFGAAFSIRRADRDPTWRWAAWACTGCVIAYLGLDYASRLRLVVM
jgi:hypothetical protein